MMNGFPPSPKAPLTLNQRARGAERHSHDTNMQNTLGYQSAPRIGLTYSGGTTEESKTVLVRRVGSRFRGNDGWGRTDSRTRGNDAQDNSRTSCRCMWSLRRYTSACEQQMENLSTAPDRRHTRPGTTRERKRVYGARTPGPRHRLL